MENIRPFQKLMQMKMAYETKKVIEKQKNAPLSEKRYGRKDVVCVMTTIPSRLPVLHNSIMSILHQTTRPDRIVVYLGKELFDGIALPKPLQELMQYQVEFRFVHDVRVHTKYFYALSEFPDSLVMTFDDDQVYRPDLLENLLKVSEEYPNSIICARAHEITTDATGKFQPYNSWKWNVVCKHPSHMLVPTGVGGVLYNPQLFSEKVFHSDEFLKLTPNADDLWLKCIEILDGIPAVTLPRKKWYLNVENSQEQSLRQDNVQNNRNDAYWDSLMREFRITYGNLCKMESELQIYYSRQL